MKLKINDGLLTAQSKLDDRSIDCILYDSKTAESIYIQYIADQLLKFELDTILQEHSGIEAMLAKSRLIPSISKINCHSLAIIRRLFSYALAGLDFEVSLETFKEQCKKQPFQFLEDQLSGYSTLGRFSEFSVKCIKVNIYSNIILCKRKMACLDRVIINYKENFMNHRVVVYGIIYKDYINNRLEKMKKLPQSKLDYHRVKIYEKTIS
ncbi:hypothetical protein [Piscirickettsia litoralis]|uniref:hypothetical protein n=1 Tax=Piscirickettsia litoralis TaxID=1891921 RepID=UPI001F404F26|nr:hypothetical protein [Piscirickettsia litoralis]